VKKENIKLKQLFLHFNSWVSWFLLGVLPASVPAENHRDRFCGLDATGSKH